MEGQTNCLKCSEHHSTRKLGARNEDECIGECSLNNYQYYHCQWQYSHLIILVIFFVNFIFHSEQCPPGTVAKIRVRPNQRIQHSLMPFCRKCSPSQYQPDYDAVKCLACAPNSTSPRGSTSSSSCAEEQTHICRTNSAICGPHGVCMRESGNPHLYSCLCEDGFTGEYYLYANDCPKHATKY